MPTSQNKDSMPHEAPSESKAPREDRGTSSAESPDELRSYLRELGENPLLSRQQEVEIAQQIESGELLIFQALVQSRMIVSILANFGEQLKAGEISIRKLLRYPDDEIGGDKTSLANQVLDAVSDLERLEVERAKSSSNAHLEKQIEDARAKAVSLYTSDAADE